MLINKHSVPLMSIPCLHQKLAINKNTAKADGDNECRTEKENTIKDNCKTEREENSSEDEHSLNSLKRPRIEISDACSGFEDSSSNSSESVEYFRKPDGNYSLTGSEALTENESLTGGEMLTGNKSLTENGTLTGNESLTENGKLAGNEALTAKETLTEFESLMGSETLKGNNYLMGNVTLKGSETSMENVSLSGNGTSVGSESLLNSIERMQTGKPCNGTENFRSSEEEASFTSHNDKDDYILKKCLDPVSIITPVKLNTYLSNLFEFKKLDAEEAHLPIFTSATTKEKHGYHHITVSKMLSTAGKTPNQIFHEYCQKVLKVHPVINKVDHKSTNDFTIEILIDDLKFGIACGDTMREARHLAAALTMDILDPTILDNDVTGEYIKIFDKLPIEDKSVLPTIREYDYLHNMKYPYQILLHLIQRNFNPEVSELHFDFNDSNGKYCMEFRNHIARGIYDNRNEGKQIASQTIIQSLYPILKSWGSVVRLVEGHAALDGSAQIGNENDTKRSKAIIRVLKREMRKLADQDNS